MQTNLPSPFHLIQSTRANNEWIALTKTRNERTWRCWIPFWIHHFPLASKLNDNAIQKKTSLKHFLDKIITYSSHKSRLKEASLQDYLQS